MTHFMMLRPPLAALAVLLATTTAFAGDPDYSSMAATTAGAAVPGTESECSNGAMGLFNGFRKGLSANFKLRISGYSAMGSDTCDIQTKAGVVTCADNTRLLGKRYCAPVGLTEPTRTIASKGKAWTIAPLDLKVQDSDMLSGHIAEGVADGYRSGFREVDTLGLLSALGLVVDLKCTEQGDINMEWTSEMQACMQDCSVFCNPEAALLSNPLADLTCGLVDTPRTLAPETAQCAMNFMFYCQGASGSMYPLCDTIFNGTQGAGPADIAVRGMYGLFRYGTAFTYTKNICKPEPDPMLKKSDYMIQKYAPAIDAQGYPIGTPTLFSWRGNNAVVAPAGCPDVDPNMYKYIVWQKKQCCLDLGEMATSAATSP